MCAFRTYNINEVECVEMVKTDMNDYQVTIDTSTYEYDVSFDNEHNAKKFMSRIITLMTASN